MEFVYHRSYRGALKAVILDWAGTAVDYGCCAPMVAFIEVFRQHGVPITIEEARGPMGVHKRTHVLQLTQLESVSQRWQEAHGRQADEADVESMFQDFVPALLDILADYTDPIPGVLEAVAAFRERGLKIGSTTGYTREMMDVVVPEAKKQGYEPDSVVCSTDVPAGRPEPWMALKSAMEMGVYPMDAIVKVGDTVPDIEEGLNAGMWTIGLAQTGNEVGLNEQEIAALEPQVLQEKLDRAYRRLYQAGAHYVVDGMWDVPAVLDEISARLAHGERP